MHAITKNYGLEEAIKLAVNGGVDIMTFSNNIQGSDERTVDKVHSLIKGMVEKGIIKKERIDESFARIMKMKKQLAENNRTVFYQQALEKSNREIEELKRTAQQEKTSVAATPTTTVSDQSKPEPSKKKKKIYSRPD
jgi:beta-N-acetylhexosaminidase